MGFSDRLANALKNVDFEEVVDSINRTAEKNAEHMLKTYQNNLRKASNSVVLRKLHEAELKEGEWGERIYQVTYDEANRRGLV